MRHPVTMVPEKCLKVALTTAFVPGKEPYEVLEKALQSMIAVRYPHDTWILDEGNDDIVKQLCKKYGANHFSRHGIEKYNTADGHFKARTKAGNYNAWFDSHGDSYEIVAQHDVDFMPCLEYLEKTLGYFRDEKVAFVGTPQIYGNADESWVARGAAEQAYGFYGPLQKGLFGLGMHLFIGANHVIRVSAHHDVGGYSGHIVEDHLTGMRLYSKGWKSVYVPEALLVGEGPSTWEAYFSQQMRWAYGLIDILFRHSPRIVPKMRLVHGINYILLQQYYFFGLAQLIGISLIGVFFVFGIESGVMALSTLLVWYPLFLIMQLVIYIWLQRTYIIPEKESGFHIPGKLLNIAAWPIYVLAFFSALVGKKLNYQVTPKGTAQEQGAPHLGIFSMHFIIGTVLAVTLIVSFYTAYQTPLMMFWAVVTIASMYYFVIMAAIGRLSEFVRQHSVATRKFKMITFIPVQAVLTTLVVVGFTSWGSAVWLVSLDAEERTAIVERYENAATSLLAVLDITDDTTVSSAVEAQTTTDPNVLVLDTNSKSTIQNRLVF